MDRVKRVALRWEDGGQVARRFPWTPSMGIPGSNSGQRVSHNTSALFRDSFSCPGVKSYFAKYPRHTNCFLLSETDDSYPVLIHFDIKRFPQDARTHMTARIFNEPMSSIALNARRIRP
jgi:hypothetical protein